jgi:PAS domain S-box-containing protein
MSCLTKAFHDHFPFSQEETMISDSKKHTRTSHPKRRRDKAVHPADPILPGGISPSSAAPETSNPIPAQESRDIADRELAEEKIQKSEAMLAQAEQLAHLGSWEWDLKTGCIIWSDNMYRLRGFAPREVVLTEEFCSGMLNPSDRDHGRHLLAQAIVSHQPAEHEYGCTIKDGRLRVFQTRFVPVFSPSGRILRIVGSTQDVTDRKLTEQKIQKSEALLDQAEEMAGLGCWEYEVSTGTTVLSRNLLEMFGFRSNDEWDRERYWDNVLHSDREGLRQTVADAIAQCRPFEYVTRYRMPDGTARTYHVRGVPFAASDGSTVRALGVVYDITGQMRKEEELRRLSQELMRTQDAERRQIARDLHESAGQTLAALKMTLANLEDALQENT